MTIPYSDIVSVSAQIQASGTITREFGRTLLLTKDTSLAPAQDAGGSDKVRPYDRLEDVAKDFPTTSEPYRAAAIYFSQTPRPKNLLIGRWVSSDTKTTLTGDNSGNAAAIRTAAGSTGSLRLGGIDITGIDLSTGNTTKAAIATSLQTVLRAVSDSRFGASLAVAVVGDEFVLTMPGNEKLGGPAGVPAAGRDLATALGWNAASGAVYRAGANQETAAAALTAIADADASFYFIATDADVNGTADMQAIGAWAGAGTYFYFAGSSEAGALTAAETTSQAAVLSSAGSKRVAISYSVNSDYLPVSIAGRMAAVNFDQPASLTTAMFRSCPGITASVLTKAQRDELDRKRINYYIGTDGPDIYATGVTAEEGVWIDQTYWLDWIVDRCQTAVFDLFVSSNAVPQTDSGVAALQDVLITELETGVQSGGIAPGNVTAATQRQIQDVTGDDEFDGNLTNGYLIYIGSLADQSQTDRAARRAPPVRIWMKGGGALQYADIAITLES